VDTTLIKKEVPGAVNSKDQDNHTIDLDSSCRSIESNMGGQDHALTWLWCNTCSCLTSAVLFTTCSQCGRSGDQIQAVDEVAGRKLLEVAS